MDGRLTAGRTGSARDDPIGDAATLLCLRCTFIRTIQLCLKSFGDPGAAFDDVAGRAGSRAVRCPISLQERKSEDSCCARASGKHVGLQQLLLQRGAALSKRLNGWCAGVCGQRRRPVRRYYLLCFNEAGLVCAPVCMLALKRLLQQRNIID